MRARLSRDGVIADLDRRGLPLTRENYIRAAFDGLPSDDEWGAEHEDTLPREFR